MYSCLFILGSLKIGLTDPSWVSMANHITTAVAENKKIWQENAWIQQPWKWNLKFETEIWWIVTDCTYIFITRTTNKGMLQEYRDSKMEGKKLRWGVDEKVKRTVCKGLLSKLHYKHMKSSKHICNKHKQLWWISLISGKDNIQRKKMAVADLRCVSMPNYITTSKAPKVPLFYPVFWHFSFNTHYNAVMFMQILTKLGLSSSRNIGSICLNKNAL